MFVEEKRHGEVKEAPVLSNVSRTLLKMADIIDERGWCQNDYQSRDGALCIIGAARAALGHNPSMWMNFDPLIEHACTRFYDVVGVRASEWNDKIASSKEEVVAKLRAVAMMPRG